MAAEDMSYMDCVASPTAAEVGEHIYDIGKTSFTQMKVLHLIGAKATVAETATAANRLHMFLMLEFNVEEIEDMQYDEPTMEHSLCKMGVAAKLKYL